MELPVDLFTKHTDVLVVIKEATKTFNLLAARQLQTLIFMLRLIEKNSFGLIDNKQYFYTRNNHSIK